MPTSMTAFNTLSGNALQSTRYHIVHSFPGYPLFIKCEQKIDVKIYYHHQYQSLHI